MTWIRNQIAPSPHLLDPRQTVQAAAAHYRHPSFDAKALRQHIADHLRAIEHEQAIVEGMRMVLAELDMAQQAAQQQEPV